MEIPRNTLAAVLFSAAIISACSVDKNSIEITGIPPGVTPPTSSTPLPEKVAQYILPATSTPPVVDNIPTLATRIAMEAQSRSVINDLTRQYCQKALCPNSLASRVVYRSGNPGGQQAYNLEITSDGTSISLVISKDKIVKPEDRFDILSNLFQIDTSLPFPRIEDPKEIKKLSENLQLADGTQYYRAGFRLLAKLPDGSLVDIPTHEQAASLLAVVATDPNIALRANDFKTLTFLANLLGRKLEEPQFLKTLFTAHRGNQTYKLTEMITGQKNDIYSYLLLDQIFENLQTDDYALGKALEDWMRNYKWQRS